MNLSNKTKVGPKEPRSIKNKVDTVKPTKHNDNPLENKSTSTRSNEKKNRGRYDDIFRKARLIKNDLERVRFLNREIIKRYESQR